MVTRSKHKSDKKRMLEIKKSIVGYSLIIIIMLGATLLADKATRFIIQFVIKPEYATIWVLNFLPLTLLGVFIYLFGKIEFLRGWIKSL